MIHLIIPPIIIVAALGALVFLFVKRMHGTENEVSRAHIPTTPAHKNDTQKSWHDLTHMRDSLRDYSKGAYEKISTMGDSLKGNQKRTVPKLQRHAPKDTHDHPQELIEKSTASFVRRRLLLQEQRRQSSMITSQSGDIDVAQVQQEERYDQEEEKLITYVAQYPHDIDAYEKLGTHYMERKSYDDARQCFKQILKLQPRNHYAQTMMKRLDDVRIS